MALKPPDMTSCKEKRKCLNGVNEGLAYDPEDPCEHPAVFNALTCECDDVDMTGQWQWTGTICAPGDCKSALTQIFTLNYGDEIGIYSTVDWPYENYRVDTDYNQLTFPNLNASCTQVLAGLGCTGIVGLVSGFFLAGVRRVNGSFESDFLNCGGLCPGIGCPGGTSVTALGVWNKLS